MDGILAEIRAVEVLNYEVVGFMEDGVASEYMFLAI